jgi:hypothetical protein
MRPSNITLCLAALAVAGTFAAAPAFAQAQYGPQGQVIDPTQANQNTGPNQRAGATAPPGMMMAVPGDQTNASNCAARFHSYDPSTGTYLGFDGRRHACP